MRQVKFIFYRDKDHFFIKMGINMMVLGETIKNKDRVHFFIIPMARNMKEILMTG